MRKKNNLRLARAIQWISGALAIIVIYPVFGLIYPRWRRMKGAGNLQETGDTRASCPPGKSIAQDK